MTVQVAAALAAALRSAAARGGAQQLGSAAAQQLGSAGAQHEGSANSRACAVEAAYRDKQAGDKQGRQHDAGFHGTELLNRLNEGCRLLPSL